MGLDLILGVFVLLAGARGWFRGFLLQAIRLGSIVGCVYAADPIRDLARPYALKRVPSIRPELLDKLLWWTAAVAFYVVASGIATWIVRAYRSRSRLEFDRNNADQGAGFLLGASKGLIVVASLASGIEQYATNYLGSVSWAREQVEASQAMAFVRAYHPADRLWASVPVRRFVAHVRRGGLELPESGTDRDRETAAAPSPPLPQLPTPSALGPLEMPSVPKLDPSDPTFLRDLDEAMRKLDSPKSR